jgi:hypothetical protein
MPRVVPSQVVSFIDQVFPWLRAPGSGNTLARVHAGEAAGLLELVDRIPEELLTLSGGEYNELVCSVAAIRDRLALWQNQQNLNIDLNLGPMFGALNPVTVIRQALSKCPDENPSAETAELDFISDLDLRASLRSDIGAVDRALANGEWKAATVLAGSTIEALLLWDLTNRHTAQVPAAVAALVANRTFLKNPPPNPEEWVLHHYIEVAANIGIIMPDTVKETRLAKDFRNLIHPGRAQRLGQKCDRGTALASVAALEHVVRDLS